MKKQLFSLTPNRPTRGFTLIELLVSAALGAIVIGATGSALLNILSSSQSESAKNQADLDNNRTLNFIASEGKQATKIIKDTGDLIGKAKSCGIAAKFNPKPVVAFQMPDSIIASSSTDKERRVVYCISDKPAPVWLGSKVVSRWGPKFKDSGEYEDPDNLSEWKSTVVIDLVDDNSSPSCAGSVPNLALDPPGSSGFYACLSGDGDLAEIHLNLRVPGSTTGLDEVYEGKIKVFARAAL